MEFDNDNSNIIGLDLPIKDSKGLAGLFLRYYSTFAALVCDTKDKHDYRIGMFTKLMISTIPDPETRDKITTLQTQMLKEGKEAEALSEGIDVSDLGMEFKSELHTHVCMEIVGVISEYVDLYLGNSKKISVSIEAAYPEASVEEDAC